VLLLTPGANDSPLVFLCASQDIWEML
jgi:hypothetical protein